MTTDSSPEPAAASSAQLAGASPRPGTRVWLLNDGRFGRVIAVAHGGLICRVRPEGAGAAAAPIACGADELFILHEAGPDER
jgi:hypothetical protein